MKKEIDPSVIQDVDEGTARQLSPTSSICMAMEVATIN